MKEPSRVFGLVVVEHLLDRLGRAAPRTGVAADIARGVLGLPVRASYITDGRIEEVQIRDVEAVTSDADRLHSYSAVVEAAEPFGG